MNSGSLPPTLINKSGLDKISVKDADMTELVQDMLIQLKINNAYNQLTHDEKIRETDIEEI